MTPEREPKAKQWTALEKAARELLAVLERWSNWDEGCLYYKSVSDQRGPTSALIDASQWLVLASLTREFQPEYDCAPRLMDTHPLHQKAS